MPLRGEARRRFRRDEDYGDSERLDGGNNQRDEGRNHHRGNRSGSVFCGRDESADARRERTGRSRADDFRHQRGQNDGGAERGNHLHHDRQKHDEHPRVH